jgi:hypothetical protein
MPESDIKDYVAAARTSSDRGRFVLIVLITTSVLAFVAFWNSRPASWLNSRIEMARIAAEACPSWNEETRQVLGVSHEDYQRSRRFYDLRKNRIGNCENLKVLANQLLSLQSQETASIRVPFFGFQFDINDLGIFGGFTFMVVLMWFRFSLARELSNVRLAFWIARNRDSRSDFQLCYDLLAMHQVLTVPATRGEAAQSRGGRFWSHVPLLLYFLPLAAEIAICWSDIRTRFWGWTISPQNTISLFLAEGAFLILISILTYTCFQLSREVDRVWDEAALDKLIKPAQPAPNAGSPEPERQLSASNAGQ